MEKLGKKLKHDHTLTSILKFAIFSLIMLAPIFSVASRCLYVICNKNAKDSYSGKQNDVYETSITMSDVRLNNIYHFSSVPTYTETSNQSSGYIIYENITNIETTNLTLKNALETGYSFQYYARVDQRQIYVYDSENNTITAQSVFTQTCTFDFQLKGFSEYSFPNTIKSFSILKETNNSYMDNTFEYSLSQLEQSSYYNWATNLGIYTPIHNMTSGLGAHDIVALLLAYWSIYTAIYIVFDIIIACFVKITHLLQSE